MIEVFYHTDQGQFLQAQTENQQFVFDFMKAWDRGQQEFELHTSGSTGEPKKVILERAQMEASAKRTLSYFKLEKGAVLVLCLSPKTVGGLMMVVRALIGNCRLHILEPNINPLKDWQSGDQIDFISMVPTQFKFWSEHNVKESPKPRNILLGGAPTDKYIQNRARDLSSKVFHGFGMTETYSHIAICDLSNLKGDSIYTVLDNISIRKNVNHHLEIKLPGKGWIITNDLIEMVHAETPQQFIWLGRADFAINSGGNKILPEKLENQILSKWSGSFPLPDFHISAVNHPSWGESIAFVTLKSLEYPEWQEIFFWMKENFKKHEIPRSLYILNKWPMTSNGKLQRARLKELISEKQFLFSASN